MEVALFPTSERCTHRPYRNTPMLLVTIFTILALSIELEAAQHFTSQPSSITANLGDKVTLPCTVSERKGTVQWTKDGFGLGTNRTLHGFDRYEMIGSAEQGEYNLYIRMVLVSDDAEYQCQVGAAQGDPILLSSKARLTVHVPPKNNEDMVSIDRASPVAATAATPIRMSCIARSSKPAPEIKWYNGQKEITSGTNTTTLPLPDSLLVSLRSMLDITPDKSHHNANISCVVSHVALETPIVRSVMMEVTYPPEVTISVDSAKIKEGDEVTFTCKAEGNPNELQYRWEVGGVTVVGGDQGPTYVMPNVTRDKNNVKVVCFVTNVIGVTSATHALSVTYEPVFKAEPVNVDGDAGSNVSLFCDVDGNPKPEVVWTHQNSDKVIKLGRKISVSISESTIGTYHCRATVPGFAEKWRSLQVFMRGSPQVPAGQASYGLEGSNIELRCVVHALPRPTSLIWSRGGHVIYPNDVKYTIREDQIPSGIVNTLSIHSSNYDDFGSYNCTAKNTFGTGSGLVELHRQQSLPLIHTLVAIIGGIVFLVIVVAAIVLFRRKGLEYKDSSFEKHSMHSNDHSSTNDSVLKVDTRTGTYTGTASELSPSDDDDENDEGNEDDGDYSHEDWESTNVDEEPRRMASRSSYRSTDIEGQTNTSGAYMPYVDYQRDYNPPPPPPPPPLPVNYNRNTIYTSIPLNNIAMDPRYNLSYGSLAAGPVAGGGSVNAVRVPGRNPVPLNVQRNMRGAAVGGGGGRNHQQTYLRLPANSRVAQNNVMYGSSGALVPQPNAAAVFSPNLGPPNTNFGADVARTNMSFGAGAGTPTLVPANLQTIANNLNDPNTVVDKNAIYSQISRNRNNLRNSNLNNSQYISIPQNDLGRNGLGTHI